MKKPIIGIVLDLAKDGEKYSYAPRPWYALRCDYSEAVVKFGGIPMLIPYESNIDDILSVIDGLIIPGGDEDINPKFYGEEITSKFVKINDKRAEFELSLTKKAMGLNMPILGICNGMQLINVILGGNLIQHIPETAPSKINHEQPRPKDIPTHKVILKEGTFAKKLSTESEIMVNSTHHQAIKELGNGLIVSGVAPDGIIEVIESDKYNFLVGVQWHSEYLNTDLDSNLFKSLIEISSKGK